MNLQDEIFHFVIFIRIRLKTSDEDIYFIRISGILREIVWRRLSKTFLNFFFLYVSLIFYYENTNESPSVKFIIAPNQICPSQTANRIWKQR